MQLNNPQLVVFNRDFRERIVAGQMVRDPRRQV
jgi:hypothetical protein